MTDESGDIDTAPPAGDAADDALEPSSELPDEPEGEAASAPPADEGDPEADEPKDLKDLRAKFPHAKSDKELLKLAAQTHWSSAREGSKVAKERDELKARLAEAEQRARPATPPEPEETPQELAEIDEAIGALTARQNAIPEQRTTLLRDMRKLEVEVEILKRDLKANEYDQDIQSRLTAAESRLEAKLDKYELLVERGKDLTSQIAAKQRERRSAEREVGTLKARQQEAAEENRRIQQEYPVHVAGLTNKAIAARSKVPLSEGLQKKAQSIVRSLTAAEMMRNVGVHAEVIVPGAVKATSEELIEFAEEYAQLVLADASKRKTAVARVPGRPTAPAGARTQTVDDGRSPVMLKARSLLEQRLGGR